MTWEGVGYAAKIDGRMDGNLYLQILKKSAIERWQTYGDQNKNIVAPTHISIIEVQKHVPPMYEWDFEKEFDQRRFMRFTFHALWDVSIGYQEDFAKVWLHL